MKKSTIIKIIITTTMLARILYSYTNPAVMHAVYGLALPSALALNTFGGTMLSMLGGIIQSRLTAIMTSKHIAIRIILVDLILGLILNSLVGLGFIVNPNILLGIFFVDLALNDLYMRGMCEACLNRAFAGDTRTKIDGRFKTFGCAGMMIGSIIAASTNVVYVPNLQTLGWIWAGTRFIDTVENYLYLKLE